MSETIDAWFGDYAVRLTGVGADGARVQCDEEIPIGARALLRFFWHDCDVEVLAELSADGLRFLDDTIELLLAQEANLLGDRGRNVYGDETLTAASSRVSRTFVTWTLGENGWTSRASLVPEQPPDGFTVYAGEPEEQVAMLRSTYENGDEESQRLTRVFAEMSVRKSDR